jgi:ABC-type nickel/cobalt efflux system permease component RcnA
MVAAVAALALGRPEAADAHPLGNFTINHYSRIDVSESGVELYRVLDMAEIPAFRERQSLDTDSDGNVSDAEADVYARATAVALLENITLTTNDTSADLQLEGATVSFPEGQGGLSLVRLEATYHAPLPAGWERGISLAYDDENYDGRIGWREVVVRGGKGVELEGSTAPSESVSGELLAYPQDGLSSPLDMRTASTTVRAGAGAPLPPTNAAHDRATRGNPDSTLGGFADLIAKDRLTFPIVALALLVAMAFGALHAMSPGHGKTIVAAYLVGSRGTWRHALLLGAIVTATHTSTVYLMGLVALYLSQYVLPEDLYPWLGVASGGLILLMGLTLLVARLRASGITAANGRWLAAAFCRPRLSAVPAGERGAMALHTRAHSAHTNHEHDDEHQHHHHQDTSDGAHSHAFGTHSHRIPGQDGEPVTVRNLVGLGVFGGMIPCPTAIVVMLSAIALHRVAFGLLLIVAFSLGLALVLTGIGFALVFGRAYAGRVPLLRGILGGERAGGVMSIAARAIPIVAACGVMAAGSVVLLRALVQQGAI